MSEINISIDEQGQVTRDEDEKHLADVNLETGEVKFANAAYAKGNYKAAIEALAAKTVSGEKPKTKAKPVKEPEAEVVTDADPRVPLEEPAPHPNLGRSSAAHINYDFANMSEKEFAAKYQRTAASKLEFTARRPELFANIEALDERLGALAKL